MELCHHYIEKHLSANLRYDPENFVPITNSVHAGHHHFGYIINDIIRDKRGEDWYRRIREKMNIKTKIDIQKAKEQLDLLKKNKKKLIKNYKRFYFFTLSYERSKGTKTGARRNIQLP
jgi:glucan phosphorylase